MAHINRHERAMKAGGETPQTLGFNHKISGILFALKQIETKELAEQTLRLQRRDIGL